jgi:hypothetical protein
MILLFTHRTLIGWRRVTYCIAFSCTALADRVQAVRSGISRAFSEQQDSDPGGYSMRILNTASASFLLTAVTKSISLDKI